jgi:hypothetical protein
VDDSNTNVRDVSTRNGASYFGVMTGCFALAFLLFSALTLVALAKRWANPLRTASTSYPHAAEPSPVTAPDTSTKTERPARVKIPARSRHQLGAVREGPGKRNQELAQLPDGTPVLIIDEAFVTEKEDIAGTWYKVRGRWAGRDGTGWIHSHIVQEEPAGSPPQVAAAPVPPPPKTSAPLPHSTPCMPCSTQEDFDATMRRGRKCCPVTACWTDSECPGDRVCCRIPNGQLCADAARCASVDRVQGSHFAERAASCRNLCPGGEISHCYCVCMGECTD